MENLHFTFLEKNNLFLFCSYFFYKFNAFLIYKCLFLLSLYPKSVIMGYIRFPGSWLPVYPVYILQLGSNPFIKFESKGYEHLILRTIWSRIDKLSSTKKILLGFCVIILLGSLLLMLPFATRSGQSTSFLECFFTATSATCVTGLVRFDTYTYWSYFGQIVILILIQLGGMGFMTVAISFIALTKRKIGLSQRFTMQESVSSPQLGGIVRMTKFILTGTLLFEGAGAMLFSFYFCPRLGFWKGIYFSVFHSVSAFCNAGFDLYGIKEPFSSLTTVQNNPYINSIIMLLIVIGGLGFFVWHDLMVNRFRLKNCRLHTKIVITTSLLLILGGAVLLFLFEQNGTCYQGLSVPQQIQASLFQSVSPRTAGFNTVDLTALTQSSQFLMVCLMLIGGSTGSTAGGMKTTTLFILVLSIFTTFRKKKSIECFGRRIDEDTLRTASCVMMLYLLLSVLAALVISSVESIPILSALFETSSAIGTVGLSLGITPELGVLSQILLILLMIFGRVGSVTILLAFASNRIVSPSKLPHEKVQVG